VGNRSTDIVGDGFEGNPGFIGPVPIELCGPIELGGPIELCGPMELGAPIDIPLMLDPGGPMLADPKLDEPRLIGRSEERGKEPPSTPRLGCECIGD